MNNFTYIKKNGFTFIELLISVGVIAISMPIIFGLFFINLKVQSKVLRTQQVKREGDNALNVIGSVIRQYARTIHSANPPTDENEVCQTTDATYTGDLYFTDIDGNVFRFYLNGNSEKIASESAKSATGGSDETFSLTSNVVTVSDMSTTCIRTSTFSPPLVNLQFSVSQNSGSSRPDEQATLNYQSTVKLRN